MMTESEFIEELKRFYIVISETFSVNTTSNTTSSTSISTSTFKIFRRKLIKVVRTLVKIVSNTHEFDFKSNIIHVSPIKYEVDMLINNNTIVELKTGMSGANKNIRKLIFETQFNNCKHVIYINIRTQVICYNIKEINFKLQK
jgi:hypothetical protein